MAQYLRIIPNQLYNKLLSEGLLGDDYFFDKNITKEDKLLVKLSPALHAEARLLLKRLQNLLEWNNKGEIVKSGKTIAGSDLANILMCIILECDRKNLVGWDLVQAALKQSNNSTETSQIGKGTQEDCQWITYENFLSKLK